MKTKKQKKLRIRYERLAIPVVIIILLLMGSFIFSKPKEQAVNISTIQKEISITITNKLKAKYGEVFAITKVNENIVRNIITAYVIPVKNISTPFVINYNTSDGSIIDNYIERQISNELSQIVVNTFKKGTVDVYAYVNFGPPSTINYVLSSKIDVTNYILQAAPNEISIRIIANRGSGKDVNAYAFNLITAMTNVSKQFASNFNFKVSVVVDSEFKKATTAFNVPDIRETNLLQYKPMATFSGLANGESVDISVFTVAGLLK